MNNSSSSGTGGTDNIIYITRDLERALVLPWPENLYAISWNTPTHQAILKYVSKLYKDNKIWLIDKPSDTRNVDTLDILNSDQVKNIFEQHPNSSVLFFKNTESLEKRCAELGVKVLNPKANLARTIEEKISQTAWLGDLVCHLPPWKIDKIKNLEKDTGLNQTNASSFIVQFNHAHTGEGTILIDSSKPESLAVLAELKKRFPERDVRISAYIEGEVYTLNVVVFADGTVLSGNISYQITGLQPFTDKEFSTIGNDWAFAHKRLVLNKPEVAKKIESLAESIGKKMHEAGWRGLFGIDCIVSNKTDEVYLIEINARQPASATYESYLQYQHNINNQHIDDHDMTTLEAHIKAVRDLAPTGQIIKIDGGAQIIKRVGNKTDKTVAEIMALGSSIINVIKYENTEPNTDLYRIQTKTGLIDTDSGALNELGQKISKIFY